MTVAAIALMLVLADSSPPAPRAETPRGMPRARLYLGPSAGQQGSTNVGSGGVVGYQSFSEITPSTASFWGLEVLGWKVGTGVLPIITADFGLRWAPFPYAFLRPYALANLGLSLLLILPVPSLAFGFGLGVPLGDAITLDIAFRARGALNIFNTAESVTIGSVEFGVGF